MKSEKTLVVPRSIGRLTDWRQCIQVYRPTCIVVYILYTLIPGVREISEKKASGRDTFEVIY